VKKVLNGTTIKWIATAAMIIDHVAWAFIPTDSAVGMICHTIGRITGPTMFLFLVEGYHHTSNLKKYIRRLVIFALVSHIPYNAFINGGALTPFKSSIALTLLLGLIATIVLDKIDNMVIRWVLVFACIFLSFWCDWPLWGVIITVCFAANYGNSKDQWQSYGITNIFIVLTTYLSYGFNWYRLVPTVISPVLVYLIFMLYDGTRGIGKFSRLSKWAFYVIYPLQFVVLELFVFLNK